jgi:hypothetical protein
MKILWIMSIIVIVLLISYIRFLVGKIQRLKKERDIYYGSFEHAQRDPHPGRFTRHWRRKKQPYQPADRPSMRPIF